MKSRYFYFDNGNYGQGETEVGEPGPGEILIKTSKSLVSVGTETKCNGGKIAWKEGLHGYSNVGRIVAVGAELAAKAASASQSTASSAATLAFTPGERVFSFRQHVDYYLGNLDTPWFVPYAIPEEVSDAEATFATLGTVALHAVERARIATGQTVVVMGQGTVGLLVAQLARVAGAGTVIGVDPVERQRELARNLGVDRVIGVDRGELAAAWPSALRNAPPPVFIEACGAVSALGWMTEAAKAGSRLVLTGSFDRTLDYPVAEIVEKELEIVGSYQPRDLETPYPYYPYNRQLNVTLILDLIRARRLTVRALVSDVIRPSDLIGFYDAHRDGRSRPSQPLIDWEL